MIDFFSSKYIIVILKVIYTFKHEWFYFNSKSFGITSLPFPSCSVAKSYLTLCDPMNFSRPAFTALHYLPEFIHTPCPLSQSCHPAISSTVNFFSSCPQSFLASGSFPMIWLFTSCSQSNGASALASVLLVNIQSWFPLRLTGLISLVSKELSGVFSSTTIQKHQFFRAQFSL